MALKKDKAKKKKAKPRAKKRMGGLVILDGKRQIDRRTGMNRDIPMGGGGGSPNLLQALATRPPITGQGGFTIQTPDQFKQAQDISTIAEEVKKQGRISIGEPTKLTGKIIDLTDVEAQKKSSIKIQPMKQSPMEDGPDIPTPSTPSPMTKVPFGKSMSPYEEMLVKQARLAKLEDEAKKTMRSQMQPPQSAGGAPRDFIPYKFGQPRNWGGGGHTAGLPSASVPTSLVGNADALGAPQPDTY